MKTAFNIKRVGQIILSDWRQQKNLLIISTVAILLLSAVLQYYRAHEDSMFYPAVGVNLFGLALLATFLVFTYRKLKKYRIDFILSPAETLEKFLALLFWGVLFGGAFLAIIRFTNNYSNWAIILIALIITSFMSGRKIFRLVIAGLFVLSIPILVTTSNGTGVSSSSASSSYENKEMRVESKTIHIPYLSYTKTTERINDNDPVTYSEGSNRVVVATIDYILDHPARILCGLSILFLLIIYLNLKRIQLR